MPTTTEWTRFKRYARRMRELKVKLSEEPVPSDTLSVLHLRTLDEPLLPNLKTLELKEAPSDVIPFIHLFLSHGTADIDIYFLTSPPPVLIASMIINLPKLCPNMRSITLHPLVEDSAITNATSEMLLTCNLDTLQVIHVDSDLTEEARQVVFQLPNLRGLWLVFVENTPPPVVSLPNLTELSVEYYYGHDWLQAFHGTALSKLTEVAFLAECEQIGDFLEAFERVALSTSASATLSKLEFCTSCSWNPNYYSLISFKRMKELIIKFSCHDGCSSRLDDEIIVTLAQAMPQLEILQLGNKPCQAPSNVTVQGLIALAHYCIGLSNLYIHFQTDSLIAAVNNEAVPSVSGGESHPPREICALTTLKVGEIPISHRYTLQVFLALLNIFPRLLNIKYVNERWKWVADAITLSKQMDSFVHHSGKTRPLCP